MDGERITRLELAMGKVESRLDNIASSMGRLEVRIDSIDGRLRTVESGLATLIERVAHLPSKGFIWTSVLALFGALSTVFLLADRIKTALGL